MYTACSPNIEGLWAPSVHANCNHNEVSALLKRSLAPTPLASPSERVPVLRVFRHLRRICGRYSGVQWSHLETALSYSGSLRRRYIDAERSLRVDGPVTVRDSILGAFLKAEKFGLAKYGKPRMIFPRSPRFNLALASYLKPFEHWLWGYLTARRVFNGSPTRVVAKGLNATQRANLIRRKMSDLVDCVVFEVDGSAFEAHVDVWQLEQEHACYSAAFSGAPELMRLLARQLVNEGTTPGGVRFSRAGGRASGDFNTGMGNTLIMLAVVVAVLKHINIKFDVLVDGDNALVFMSQCDSARVLGCFGNLALSFSGHEMVLERPVTVLEHVRFGQSAPLELSKGRFTMVRDWRKVCSQMTSNHAHLNVPKFVRPYLKGVSQCELALNSGVPVIQAFARRLLTLTEDAKTVGDQFYRDYEVLGVRVSCRDKSVFREPTTEARESFHRAFGLDPDAQLAVEKALGSVDLKVDGWEPEESPWQFGFFSARPGLVDKFFGVEEWPSEEF
jgi:hypothetical protein